MATFINPKPPQALESNQWKSKRSFKQPMKVGAFFAKGDHLSLRGFKIQKMH